MCGIVGYLNLDQHEPAEARVVEAMCQTIIHRGPDDHGLFTKGPVGLGMRRLSIIDLDTGHQPISNEAKDIWIVFNGEIYNYRELADWLVARGHSLSTSSDTEVIVHLYEELGHECVHKLRGMFAFAIWDETRAQMFIARDRLGVKPLYYFWDQRRLVFGSELKALLAHPHVKPALDPRAVLYYLRYSYIPDPLTIFQQVTKLPPGHFMTLTGGSLSVKQYWDGARPESSCDSSCSEEEALHTLEFLLHESVRLRLVSDVPLGAFLSGGIDSSLIVALMAREMTQPVKTFSIGFEEASYNELPYARQVARHFGTDHHELVVGPQGCDLIERMVSHFDEPMADPSAVPTYALSKLTAGYVKVALTGDGGDELFAGYDRYRIDLQRNRFRFLPSAAKHLLGFTSDLLPEGFTGKRWMRSLALPAQGRYLENISYFDPRSMDKILTSDFRGQVTRDEQIDRIMTQYFDRVGACSWLAQLQYLDTKTYLPADILTKVDRMSMAHSLEARGPFLDHVLTAYAAELPMNMKFRNGVSKYLLKRLAERLLPSDLVHRKKQGFGVPLEYWFRKGSLREYIRDVLFDSRTRGRAILAASEVERLVSCYEQGRHDLATTIWLLVIFETWCRLYLDQGVVCRSSESAPLHHPDKTPIICSR